MYITGNRYDLKVLLILHIENYFKKHLPIIECTTHCKMQYIVGRKQTLLFTKVGRKKHILEYILPGRIFKTDSL